MHYDDRGTRVEYLYFGILKPIRRTGTAIFDERSDLVLNDIDWLRANSPSRAQGPAMSPSRMVPSMGGEANLSTA